MQYAAFLIVLFLSSACGLERHPEWQWPARIAKIEGFSEQQLQELGLTIDELNTEAGQPVIIRENDPLAYPITLRIVSSTPESPKRVGYAVLRETHCEIEIDERAFELSDGNFLKSIVWHELGHCAGLDHNNDQFSVMYFTTAPFETYSNEALDSFVGDFINSAGIAIGTTVKTFSISYPLLQTHLR